MLGHLVVIHGRQRVVLRVPDVGARQSGRAGHLVGRQILEFLTAARPHSDHLILIGVFIALLINSITTEGLGAGVNVMAIWLFLSGAWSTILDADQRRTGRSTTSTGGIHGAAPFERTVR